MYGRYPKQLYVLKWYPSIWSNLKGHPMNVVSFIFFKCSWKTTRTNYTFNTYTHKHTRTAPPPMSHELLSQLYGQKSVTILWAETPLFNHPKLLLPLDTAEKIDCTPSQSWCFLPLPTCAEGLLECTVECLYLFIFLLFSSSFLIQEKVFGKGVGHGLSLAPLRACGQTSVQPRCPISAIKLTMCYIFLFCNMICILYRFARVFCKLPALKNLGQVWQVSF